MTTYVFDAIDPAHPPLLESTDTILFHGGPARLASVAFGVQNGVSIATISFGGHVVGFPPEILSVAANRGLVFDDGSNLLIGSPRNEEFHGGAGDDALYGGDGTDTLNGHLGNNFIQGNQGADSLAAEGGADTILGGQGDDFIRPGLGLAGEAGDFVNGNLGNDTIGDGGGTDTLLGGQGNDVIAGGGGADFLNGNLGDDRVVADGAARAFGEAGADTLQAVSPGVILSGGEGADLFAFNEPSAFVVNGIPANAAVIADWSSEDQITFAGVATNHAFATLTFVAPPDFEGAYNAASATISSSSDPAAAGGEIVLAQVGADVFVFAANAGSHHVDTIVHITGRTLADIGAGDFI